MNLQTVLRGLPRPSVADFKFRVTLGFFDPQTRFFQPTIPNDVFAFFTDALRSAPIKGVVVDTVPVVHAFQVFEKFGHIAGTMWDVRVDYVQCERQGIFLNSGTKTIVAVCSLEFLERMQTSFEEFVSVQPEVGETVRFSRDSSLPGQKLNCEIVTY